MQYIEFVDDALKLSPYAAKYALVLIKAEPLLQIGLMTRLRDALVHRSVVGTNDGAVLTLDAAHAEEALAAAFVQRLLQAPVPRLDLEL
ncbi:MAG: hypothetical protein EON54_27820 [Alcaligenaceae bacterium]|nr:MAG: hypothetical protein EON54_27820 [Alcaligenaceae bacterium]